VDDQTSIGEAFPLTWCKEQHAQPQYVVNDLPLHSRTMDSDKALAITLPRKVPNAELHRATLNGLVRYKFAVYNTAPFDLPSRRQLETTINSAELSTGRSKLAPKPDFSNRSL
jgi:hypothetical protein